MRHDLRRILASLALCAVLTGSLTVPASAAFRDVPAGHWAAGSIERCVEQGFFNGQSADRFGLGQRMSRSAFAVVLCRFFGWETAASAVQTYSDVPMDAWYAGAVEAAYRHGALTDQREVFRPNDPITREELAVMLVRALGYGEVAGLAQDLPMPFRDVTTNVGYITMAHDLGLMSGTTATTFSPAVTASREQVAVILMRLYDKLHGERPEIIGVVSPESDLTGLDVAAIPAARAAATAVEERMKAETAAAVQAAARSAGARVFLNLELSRAALNGKPDQVGALIAEAAVGGGYDGLMLNALGVTEKNRADLVRLVGAVNEHLGSLPFYLVVEVPSREGEAHEGYHYEELAAAVDRLILRVSEVQTVTDAFVTAPVDPPEEICYAVASLKAKVGIEKLALMLDAETSCWSGSSRSGLSGETLAEWLADTKNHAYHSDRYACSYLTGTNSQGRPFTVWYLAERDVETRVQLAGCLGLTQLCVSDWDAATEAFLAGLD